MELRPYQTELIQNIRKSYKSGKRSICAVLPCRAGKSVVAAMIAKSATDKGNRVLFIVHRKELCAQITQTFRECGVDMLLCTIGMVQTITRRLDKTLPPKMIITDEFHHCYAKSYRNIYERFSDALILGFTATPIRLKEKGLGDIADDLIVGVTAQWLIDNGYMSDYDYYNNKLVVTDALKITAGDYNQHDIDVLMDDNIVFVGAVENYVKYANGKQAIVYCTNVENSKQTAAEFIANGIPAGYITGSQATQDRQQAMRDFKDRKIKILTSCEVISEGIDIADCECCILMRPTKSLSLFIQQSMRCLTYKPGKRAVILDLVGNYGEHGAPTQDRTWSLNGMEKQKFSTKECEECYFVYDSKLKACPHCGHVNQKKSREDTEIEKEKALAELEMIDKSRKLIINYTDCSTFEELKEFQKRKGYKFGWCIYKAENLNIDIPAKYDKYRKIRDNVIGRAVIA